MLTFVLSFPIVVQIGLLILSLAGGLKIYLELTKGVCNSTVQLTGKTVIITGANTGIGKETAIDLAKRGARIILACRDTKKGIAAKDDIVRHSGNDNVIVRYLDLASLPSVRNFATLILKSEQRLDILINNAGCIALEKRLTADGLESQMQTNHFGHFLLTNLLLGLMIKSTPSRIINVSSNVYRWMKTLDLNNLNSELSYNNNSLYHGVYYTSKLCQILCTRHLAPLVNSSGVTVNSLCPGVVHTEIFRTTSSWFQMLAAFVLPIFFKTAKEGAQTSIYLAVADEVSDVTGEFFRDCKIEKTSRLASDTGLAKKVWELSESFVGLKPEERHY